MRARSGTLNRERETTLFALVVTATQGKAYVSYLKKSLGAARRLIPDASLRELSLALVGDARMSELHERFMNIPGPTDVLTFPLEVDSRNRTIAGEVVVCVPEARRRAKDVGTDVRNELLLYALHGMLHLCGFDDRTDRQYHRMHRMEDQILRQLGVGPVFAPVSNSSKRRRRP